MEITTEGHLIYGVSSEALAHRQKSFLKKFDIGGKTGQRTCFVGGKGENHPTIPDERG